MLCCCSVSQSRCPAPSSQCTALAFTLNPGERSAARGGRPAFEWAVPPFPGRSVRGWSSLRGFPPIRKKKRHSGGRANGFALRAFRGPKTAERGEKGPKLGSNPIAQALGSRGWPQATPILGTPGCPSEPGPVVRPRRLRESPGILTRSGGAAPTPPHSFCFARLRNEVSALAARPMKKMRRQGVAKREKRKYFALAHKRTRTS